MEAAHGVVLGFDVGRYSHHMTAIDARTGEVAASRPVDQDESGIREALGPYADSDAIVVVDQPGHLSSLLFAVAREMGLEVGFITPKAMARGIDLYGGEVKTDKRDSFVIADLALRIPSLVHGALTRYGNEEELAALMSFDRELRFCEESRVYYDRKRAEGRCHYSAVIALARRRINVVYAMLRDGQRFESRLG